MKTMIATLSLAWSIPALAALSPYTYQTRVVKTHGVDCQAEAQQLANRFQAATGAAVTAAVCRSVQVEEHQGLAYKVLSLGLRYQAEQPFNPYTIQIGKNDPALGRGAERVAYSSMEGCRQSLAEQTRLYNQQTEISVVSATCFANVSYTTAPEYILQVDGFTTKPYPVPKKRLFLFAPFTNSQISATPEAQIGNLLANAGAVIVRRNNGAYAYYLEKSVSLNSATLATLEQSTQCEAQIGSTIEIYTKAGNSTVLVFCDAKQLQVVFTGGASVSENHFASNTDYATFQECMNDRDFVLSDVRNAQALGAICAPSTYNLGKYAMKVYTKLW
ncbi:MAG: hypothetical protein AB7N80_16230 [Bdellovibrionales bacterium]